MDTKRRKQKGKRFMILTLATALLACELSFSTVQVQAENENPVSISANEIVKNDFTSVNPLIDVGDKIYVQHYEYEENEDWIQIRDTYQLTKSDTGITTVYEVILPNFTAHRAWTPDGVFMENVSLNYKGNIEAHGATAPEDYIPVKAGEEYFFRLYGVWGTNNTVDGKTYKYTPVLFMNDADEVIGTALESTLSQGKKGKFVTVPEGATKMHLTNYNNQNFTVQKTLHLTDEEFHALTISQNDLENELDEKYEKFVQDRTVYDRFDKAYITFVNDDSWGTIHDYANMFIEKDIPLVLATLPEALIENSSSVEETRLQVAKRVEQAGGEIIAHNATPLTQEGFSDYSTMYSFFVKTKQMFNAYNLDVNGIILSGGTGQVTGAAETERWASSIYSYSDLYGVQGDVFHNAYFYGRGNIGNYRLKLTGTEEEINEKHLEKIKEEIDKTIANKTWRIFYWHSANEIPDEVLEQTLDYVKTKSQEEVEIVTYKEMYERKAAKQSEVAKRKKVYYVSNTGTSTGGTSSKNPMSYEAANKTTFHSGDTILFKRGEDYYGAFNPTIKQVDDSVTIVSAYGEGERPNILGYKIANSEESWELDEEGIYKINLTDPQRFTGLMTTDANSVNIGFLEDSNGVKCYNKVGTKEELVNPFDFYCDETYLYIKCDENPYKKLGELKLATKTNLFYMHSNMRIKNLRVAGTGAHGLLAADATTKNVEISYNLIEDIGGSFLKGTTRYGNGIEFYGTDTSDIVVKNNMIRNIYDVAFTIQGTKGSGTNVLVRNNVFVANTQDSEIWESEEATGIQGYNFTKNISVNQGRGWGYEARPDKYPAAHILFWSYLFEDTDICFSYNKVYNPRRLYFVEQSSGTNILFQETDGIKSDYNEYFVTEGVPIFRDYYKIGTEENAIDTFIQDYRRDKNSVFTMIEVDDELVQVAENTIDPYKVKELFLTEEEMAAEKLEEEADQKSDEIVEEEKTEEDKTEEGKPEEGKTEDDKNNENKGSEVDSDIRDNPKEEEKVTEEGDKQKTEGVPEDVSTVPEIPSEGKLLTSGAGIYKVTISDIDEGTVAYVGPESSALSTIKIPATVTVDGVTYKVTAIDDYAFKNNKKLKKITIGSNIITIGKQAFYGCKNLKTVTIGKSVKTIKDRAFYKCTSLTKITIPSKVTKIGKQAFYGCKKLKKITIKTTKLKKSKVGSKAFKGTPKNVQVKVPKTKNNLYKEMLIKKGMSKNAKISK